MSLSAPLFCDTCGAANRVQASFCAVCGNPLRVSIPAYVSNQNSIINTQSSTSSTLTGLLTQRHMLKQRYLILNQVGRGGFGAVYKAADTQFGNRTVAVKEMSQNSLTTLELAEAIEAFKREAFLLASLTHPNLPRIYEQFTDAGRSYLVMDFIEGKTLEDILLALQGKKLPVEKVLEIGIQLSAVLEYLHTRQPTIIFRDLKPANVMLTSTGHIFLLDFGIARHFKPGKTKDTSALGSSGYAAPEQYGRSQTTPQADIYSLGATLHQLLTGNDPADSPFHFAPLQLQYHPALVGLDTLIMSMVTIEISKRPVSATVVKQKLQQIATTLKIHQTNPLPAGTTHAYQIAPVVQAPAPTTMPNLPPKAPRSAKATLQQVRPQANTLYVCFGHTSRITALAWSPDGKYLASASYDKTVQVWDASNGKHLLTYKGHTQRVQTLTWSPDSKRIASGSDDATVHIWNAITGAHIMTYTKHTGEVRAVAWSPDGSRIASAGTDTTVQVWNATTGTVSYTYTGHGRAVEALTWSPDNRRIASGGEDQQLHVWAITQDVQKRSLFSSLFSQNRSQLIIPCHTGNIKAVAWSPDRDVIAGATHHHRVHIWNANSRSIWFSYGGGSSGIINAIAWSSGGKYLASGSNDKTVEIWNTQQRRPTFTYRGHTGYVMAVAWSPDGSHIASAGVDRTIQVWQAV